MPTRTALYDRHVALGARMTTFAGWLLPLQYPTGALQEHARVREAAGLFDINHMGRIAVSGSAASPFLQRMVTSDVSAMGLGDARYGLLCYDDGGVVDDVFIYALEGRYLVVVNAANAAKDRRWLSAHAHGLDVEIRDISAETYMLALQGPAAEAILDPLCPVSMSDMGRHTCRETTVLGVPAIVGRTGYTGEDGFELYLDARQAGPVWDGLLEAGKPWGLAPAGLAARDSLRFEACLPLYGHELGPDRDPIAAGLGWAIAWDKGGFLGREALLKVRLEGPAERLIGIEMVERGVPREGYRIFHDGEPCGVVTSGMLAPTLERFLALGYVPAELATPSTALGVEIHGRVREAIVVKRPFYMRGRS
ncbi:MAG: glycine cleavage system aminomethyltransferase GcvT [Anaerolineae bacterium]|nr:glycine cleavage system aminomethyltransferase GcvT [Anaerolineae bacterium]